MSSAVDGTIYLFGGSTADLKICYDLVLAYDPAQDRFTARRKMPRTRCGAGCAAINGKIYLAGGVSAEPIANTNAIYYTVVDVLGPQGGVPQVLSLTCESANQVRLVWQGEAGISYGVESGPNVATGTWTRATFTSGTNSVVATNALVEATCIVPVGDTNRFFRILEANERCRE